MFTSCGPIKLSARNAVAPKNAFVIPSEARNLGSVQLLLSKQAVIPSEH
jgi:hypothetical protein